MGGRVREGLAILAWLAIVGWPVNFLWFWGEGVILGGDAVSGYRRDGQCFVSSHGSYRQVDCGVWEAERIHVWSVWVTLPLAVLGMAYLHFSSSRQGRAEATERERALRASGPELASGSPRGRIGGQSRGWLLEVRVFPGGLLLKPVSIPQRTVVILKAEITDLRVNKPLLGQQYVEIGFTSPMAESPVILYISPKSDLAGAIEQMAERPLGPA